MVVIGKGETSFVALYFWERSAHVPPNWAISGANNAGGLNGETNNGFTVSYSGSYPSEATVSVPAGANPGECLLQVNIIDPPVYTNKFRGNFQVNPNPPFGFCPGCE